MLQRSVISETTRAEALSIPTRWMRHFFTEDTSPDNHPIVERQQRAVWIGLALILQALNEIDHDWYIPYLMPFGSLIPFALILSSFFAMWMAFYPPKTRRCNEKRQGEGKSHLARWQHVLLTLTLLITIAGSLQFGRTLLMVFLPPQFSNDGTSLVTNTATPMLQRLN